MPQALESEQSTLGAMVMDRSAILEAVSKDVKESDFYREIHGKIFKAIMALFNRGETVDLITLVEELRSHGQLEEVGGFAYLQALIEGCPSSANVAVYVRPVLEKSEVRAMIRNAEWTIRESQRYEDFEAFRDEVQKRHLQAAQRLLGFDTNAQTVASSLGELLTDVFFTISNPNAVTGVQSGFTDLDNAFGGFEPGELIIVGARPAMGKSALVMQMAYHAAKTTGRPAFIYSLEMRRKKLVRRLACQLGNVNAWRLKKGRPTDEEMLQLAHTVEEMRTVPMFIDDTRSITAHTLRASAQRLALQHGNPSMIVIDYLQLMEHPNSGKNRNDQLAEIVRQVRALGLTLECPMVCPAQLSRSVESRDDKRPMPSDLRDSGGLEAEADGILFPFRPEYYRKKELGEKIDYESLEVEPAEIIIAKNREGAATSVPIGFQGAFVKFVQLATVPQNTYNRSSF